MVKICVKYKIRKFDVEISGDSWAEVLAQIELAPDQSSSAPSRASTSTDIGYTGTRYDGTVDDLVAWLDEHGPRPRSRIERESPFTKPRTLIQAAERMGLIVPVETLYERKSGGWGTMAAYYTQTMDRPKHPSPAEASPTVMAFAADHEGFTPKAIEERCGVVRSVAKRALTQLLLDRHLEVRVGPDKQGRVFVVGNNSEPSGAIPEKTQKPR